MYIFGIIAILVIIVGILIYKSMDLRRKYKAEVAKELERSGSMEGPILTGDDIKHLPEPVRRYINNSGAMGRERVQNVKILFEGDSNLDPQKERWSRITAEQYNFFDNFTRLFYIRGKYNGIPYFGLHSYGYGESSMLIKLFGLITVVDVKGQDMYKSETVTTFNDMCLFAPAALIDRRIKWEAVDTSTVRAIFDNNGCMVSAVLYFNDKGELVNFISDDRYRLEADGSLKKARWSTPVKYYKEICGVKVPGRSENSGATWQLPEGDYCYMKLDVKDIRYNCRRLIDR